MIEKIIIILGCYFIGSIPFAYLITKATHGVDLRSAGSKNIGARNAYEVTNHRGIGIGVLILDLLKGAIPIFICERLVAAQIVPFAVGAIVLGHCYPVWLRFHGGRGLATAAGILLVISPLFVAVWLALYWLAGKIYNNVHVDSLVAIMLIGVLSLILPSEYIIQTTLKYSPLGVAEIRESIVFIALILTMRHIGPVRDLFRGV